MLTGKKIIFLMTCNMDNFMDMHMLYVYVYVNVNYLLESRLSLLCFGEEFFLFGNDRRAFA